ncbi:MAG: hypothetical protein US52_C0053G0013 [candidate division WS6 bacterium GW2011_GWA2_37_6]|uniref:Uncharacterized protein n=1 Tax=candidate division WS6 bacterium GW2011_GWA2_37_6 TaxID=1619087 RepID=A0A0G0H7V5_9BACT|nr:MAG: hypothetical protein US52_C0053G0013 [candidate division WS6 bacterium GW2011_GWA2_37_6]
MTDYRKALQTQKAKVKQEIDKYFQLEKRFRNEYKLSVIRKYMTLWDKSGKFPLDPELTDTIFYLAGMPTESPPKIEFTLDKCTYTYHLKYFNKRLNQYIELEPSNPTNKTEDQYTYIWICDSCNYDTGETRETNTNRHRTCPKCGKRELVTIKKRV